MWISFKDHLGLFRRGIVCEKADALPFIKSGYVDQDVKILSILCLKDEVPLLG